MGIRPEPRYASYADVIARLDKTIVRYKGEFYSCHCLNNLAEKMAVYLTSPRTADSFTVHSSDLDLDLSAPELGYYNRKGTAVYCCRMPARKIKQCVCVDNTIGVVPNSAQYWESYNLQRDDFKSRGFFSMLYGEYPPVDHVINALSVEKQIISMAFSRRFSINLDEIGLKRLYYFLTPIAVFNKRRALFVLSERFSHYKRILDHFRINCEIGD